MDKNVAQIKKNDAGVVWMQKTVLHYGILI
jgi:hypothetical protein